MKAVSYRDVTLNSGFLYQKHILNKNITIDAVYNRFYETGRIKALKFEWKEGMRDKPHFFWDSDVAKWIEGAAYTLQKENNKDLEAKIESIIDDIETNQGKDGYFNTYFTVCEPGGRFKDRDKHELYCAGHFFEAAVAYYEATGRDRLLRIMEKYADYIKDAFVNKKTAEFVTPGHEEIELALVRMYRATGEKKYLELAAFFINKRGIDKENEFGMLAKFGRDYTQSHLPVREQSEAVGHCVRACYLYSAMVDLAYETSDMELYATCKTLFEDIINKKMYITGGIGSTRIGEAFTVEYDLKNDKAYAETCAAISLMFFAHRMMQFENNAEYADLIERILYNGMMVGLSLDGKAFFYENPLEIDMRNYVRFRDAEEKEEYAITKRVSVFNCSCCPPNLNRVLASLGGYVYGYDDNDTVFVNQFVGSTANIGEVKVVQKTEFPKVNEVRIETENVKKLCIRIPKWCAEFEINKSYVIENGYAVVEELDTEVIVKFDMTPFLVQSNTEVYENCGKVAVCCGPFVCAAESADNVENLHNIYIDKNCKINVKYSDDLSGFVLDVKSYCKTSDKNLYSRYTDDFEDFTLKMIPYASFANRSEGNMCVWFNVK